MKTYITFAPSAVLKGGYHLEERIIEDLNRFKQNSLLSPHISNPRGSIYGFDTEYSPDSKLLTVGIADSGNAIAIETTEKDWLPKFKKILSKAKVICGHSVVGDLDYLVKNKIAKNDWLIGRNVLDSFLLARMVDENRGKGSYGLEALLLSEVNFSEWKSETAALLKKTGNAADWTVQQRTERCRLDSWATHILAERFKGQIDSDLSTFTHQIALSLHRVGLAGAAIDLPTFHKLGKKWTREAKIKRDLIVRYAHRHGMKEFIPTNDNHIRELLYEHLDLPVLQTTGKSRAPSVDKGTLKRLLKEHGDSVFIRNLITFNESDKLSSTWYGRPETNSTRKKSVSDLIVPIPERTARSVKSGIGLLHLWVYPLRARTGRRTSGGGEEGDPDSRNSQNWPPAARSVIASRWRKGQVAVCDFTRLEVVLIAWRSGDEKLLDFFLNGEGYIGVAKEFWGQDVKDGSLLYKATKCIVLGLNYNMGAYKLAHDLWYRNDFKFSEDWDTHVKKTVKARKRYLQMFFGLRRYIRERIAEVTETQQVISPSGRIRHLPHHGPESEGFWHVRNSAVNFPIQSFASDVTGSAIVDYEAALLKEHNLSYGDWHSALLENPWDLPCSPVFNEVHDELDLDMHPKTGKRDLEILRDAMENVRTLKKLVPEFKLKLKVDVKVNDTWK